MCAGGDGQGDARVAEIVEAARHAGSSSRLGEVAGEEARRGQRVAGSVSEDQLIGPRLRMEVEVGAEKQCGEGRDGDRPHTRGSLGFLDGEGAKLGRKEVREKEGQ